MSDDLKRRAAQAAAEAELKSGMKLGLGTGSTAKHFVDIVGERVRAGQRFLCVPTSEATRAQAQALGIPLASLDEAGTLDLVVDGADEIDTAMHLIKGAGGALVREKIVAFASRRMVVIADTSKSVAQLGTLYALPVEVVQFAHASTARALIAAFAKVGITTEPRLRQTKAGAPFISDNGNYIYDCANPGIPDPPALAAGLDGIPGMAGHGLFIGLCSAAYLASDEGVAVLARRA